MLTKATFDGDVVASTGKPSEPTMIVSEMNADGNRLVRKLDTLDDSFTNSHWEAEFDGLRVLCQNVLGAVGKGFRNVQVRMAKLRLAAPSDNSPFVLLTHKS